MNEEIKWQAFEYSYKDKTADWFWIVWIIAIGITITAYLFNNMLFGIFILLSAFSLSIYASRRPDLLKFSISKKGFLIGARLIPFSSFISFWIEDENNNSPDNNEQRKIILRAKNKTVPYVIIPLDGEVDTERIREYLLRHLEEKEHHEPLFQRIFEKLGF
jgi:hypothetical protein